MRNAGRNMRARHRASQGQGWTQRPSSTNRMSAAVVEIGGGSDLQAAWSAKGVVQGTDPLEDPLVQEMHACTGGGASDLIGDTAAWSVNKRSLEVVRFLLSGKMATEAKMEREVRAILGQLSEEDKREDKLPYKLYAHLQARGKSVHLAQSERASIGMSEIPHIFLWTVDEADGKSSIIIEPNFKAAFRVGRAARRYEELLGEVPDVVCARQDRLKALVEFLCEQLASSFADLGMDIPPWRRAPSVLAKWQLFPRGDQNGRHAAEVTNLGTAAPGHSDSNASNRELGRKKQPEEDSQGQGKRRTLHGGHRLGVPR